MTVCQMITKTLELVAAAFRYPYDPGEELAWWEDNLGHLACGIVIGAITQVVIGGLIAVSVVFLACATLWEIFEYMYGIRPWDPEEDWPIDRAVEDTLLDTYVGLTGALGAAYILIVF